MTRKNYDYDIVCIGLGPAGMAVSHMASAMGLKVCAIEKNKLGGECMNVGCIPSKALLKMAEVRNSFRHSVEMGLAPAEMPRVKDPFKRIRDYIQYIDKNKNSASFKKFDIILREGPAGFVDDHMVSVGGRKITARKIFIATGTVPTIPPIPGIDKVEILTNNNLFDLEKIPESLTIIGGGAIGSEMAQAFSRLGSKCVIVQMDPFLIPIGDKDAGDLLEEVFKKEGITVHNSKKIGRLERESGKIILHTEDGIKIPSEKILIAAGRSVNLEELNLGKVNIKYTKKGVSVNRYLQTSQPHIYAVGDCNGHFLLTHAAMQQGMIGLLNAVMPWPFKKDFKKCVVPWTVFTEPSVSYVGMKEEELKAKNIEYETITARYEDYGAAVAENIGIGFVKAFVSRGGQVYGVSIVGENSGEMINEWALIIQNNIRLHDFLMVQHSFPTMGFLSKRIAEKWMQVRIRSKTNILRFLFRYQA